MAYRCTVPNARPCIYDSTYDPDLATGKIKGKVIRKYKTVKMDGEVGWVDPCSRKHFEPTDEATKRQDKEDFKKIKSELESFGVDIPNDTTLWECAENLTKLKSGNKVQRIKKRNRVFGKKEVQEQELTRKELMGKLDDIGIKYHPNSNKASLKQLLADNQPDKDD